MKVHIAVSKIIGTNTVYYTAYRECETPYRGYSSFMTIGGKCCGRVGSEDLPAELDKLPARSKERYEAVREWINTKQDESYRLILAEYPALESAERFDGEIVVG